eukprot:8635980-Lingulodinium_polyedra.AAC.1
MAGAEARPFPSARTRPRLSHSVRCRAPCAARLRSRWRRPSRTARPSRLMMSSANAKRPRT